jgi:pyruvate formate lyase activating enzyme
LSGETVDSKATGREEPPRSGGAPAELTFRAVLPVTMVDYPGKLAYTVYTMGCNFRCPICHNRELALSLGDDLPEYSVDWVLGEIARKDGWVDGICVTGGEPLLCPGLSAALERFKAAGLAVKLDTNGSFPEKLAAVLRDGLADCVAMDVKAPLTAEDYPALAGVAMDRWMGRLRSSIEIIKASGLEYEFRTVCVPRLHSPESIARIARDLAPCDRYVLRAFRPMNTLDPEYENVPAPTPEEMSAYLAAAREHLPNASAGSD